MAPAQPFGTWSESVSGWVGPDHRQGVKPEDLAPEVWVFATGNPRNRAANAKTVVIVPRDGQAVQPTAFEPHTQVYSNAFGVQHEGTEALARFPLSALGQDAEIRVVYDAWECIVPVEAKKVR